MDYISYKSSPAFKMIDNYIYLYHLDKFCVLPTYPDTLTDNMSTTFKDTNALSRSAPVFSYIQSGPRTITISLPLHRDLMTDLNRNVSNLKDNVVDFSGDDYIDTLVAYLQACSVPRYNEYSSGSKSVIPPMVAIRFGNTMFVKGVITSGVSVDYNKPILWNGKYASVRVAFTVTEINPYDADSIAAEGSFRGISSTFRNGIYASTDADNLYGNDSDISSWADIDAIDDITDSKTNTTTPKENSQTIVGNGGSETHDSSSGNGGGGSHTIDVSNPTAYIDSYVYKQNTGQGGNKGYSGITVGTYSNGLASNYNR